MDAMKPWEVLESKTLLERKWLRVREEKVRTSSGYVIDEFHLIESPPWASVICVSERRELILVEQYRHGHEGLSLEFPAGVVDPGEDVALGAQRELLEETGFAGGNWHHLLKVRPEPARHRQWADFFVALGCHEQGAPSPEPSESIRVVPWPLDAIDDLISRMTHGLHLAALLLAERRGLLELR